jgi:hypothetical protein
MIEQGRIACTIERYSVVDNELHREWGGRNYPEIRITAEDLLKLEEILNV